jgi:hypothetical protein
MAYFPESEMMIMMMMMMMVIVQSIGEGNSCRNFAQ